MLPRAVRAMLFPALQEQSLNRDVPGVQGWFLEEQFVSKPWKVLQHTLVWEGSVCLQEEHGPHHRFVLPGFPSLCFAVCTCLTILRSSQDLWGFQISVQSPGLQQQHHVRVWEGLGSVCFVFLTRGRNLQHPAGVEAAQNELQSPQMTCRPLKGSCEDFRALSQYLCSVIYRTGHVRALIDGLGLWCSIWFPHPHRGVPSHGRGVLLNRRTELELLFGVSS